MPPFFHATRWGVRVFNAKKIRVAWEEIWFLLTHTFFFTPKEKCTTFLTIIQGFLFFLSSHLLIWIKFKFEKDKDDDSWRNRLPFLSISLDLNRIQIRKEIKMWVINRCRPTLSVPPPFHAKIPHTEMLWREIILMEIMGCAQRRSPRVLEL